MAKKQTAIINYSFGDTESVMVKTFIDEMLKPYSAHSNVRGIPFLGDGMKQSQRKAIYGFLCRGENSDKDTVERISARVCSDTDYHHGVGSMEGTVVCLAQKFTGSNNISLIESFGQFGNRLSKKPASSRYIKAKLSSNFRKLFKKEDDLILQHYYSNGDKIEPHYFIPLLPMSLINGAEGMGTGHSTYIMSHNPADIKAAIQQILKGKKLTKGKLIPWFKGFKGTVERDSETNQIVITGNYELTGGLTLLINELPIGIQNDPYEVHLHKLIDKEIIKNFTNSSDEEGFDVTIIAPRTTIALSHEEILKQFKLVSRETENLTLWDTNGSLKRFDCAEDIVEEFVEWRLGKYEERRLALIKVVEDDIVDIDERIRFINFYLSNHNMFKSTPKKELLELLLTNEFRSPERLLGMQIWSLTYDRILELNKELDKQLVYLETLRIDTAKEMFQRELNDLKIYEPI